MVVVFHDLVYLQVFKDSVEGPNVLLVVNRCLLRMDSIRVNSLPLGVVFSSRAHLLEVEVMAEVLGVLHVTSRVI